MKKALFSLFLGISICCTGITTDISAAEPAPENTIALQETYEDLSDELIQEGGFPTETKSVERRARSFAKANTTSGLSAKETQIQNLLINAWNSFSNTCDLTAFQITPDELHNIYVNTLNSNPRYFYVYGGYSYSISGNYVSTVMIKYTTNDVAAAKTMRDAYDSVVSNILSKADNSWSDMEKALYINDYLARNCEYDTSYSKYTAYDVFVNGTAVCQGYALAFLDLAHELGLSCEMVSSNSLNHAWDMVKIGNSYYNVDVTWNDPVADRLGRARHIYFLKSTDFFQSETGGHAGTDWVLTGGISKDAASQTKYDNYFWNACDSGFDYVNGSWYGFDGQNSIYQYTCNGTDLTAVKPLVTIDDVWNVFGNEMSYWQGKYVGTGSYDGKLYYSAKCDIYELNPQTGGRTAIFSLTEEQKKTGYLYGMNLQGNGELKYLLATSPNESGTVYLAKTFAPTRINIANYTVALTKQEKIVYDGKEKCPDITVKNRNTVLRSSDYEVSYSNHVHAGTAVITVKGKGNYTGTATGRFTIQKADNRITATTSYNLTEKTTAQSLKLNVRATGGSIKYQSDNKNVTVSSNGTVSIPKNFRGRAIITATAGNSDYKDVSTKITITVNLSGTKLSQAKNLSGKKLSLKWKKNSSAAGYQIQYATNRNFNGAKIRKISGASKTKITLKGLKKKKTYYVRIRTYNRQYVSAWSSPRKVKISK